METIKLWKSVESAGTGNPADDFEPYLELYLLDGTGVLFLITASVMVSGIVILKRNPKDILSEMS